MSLSLETLRAIHEKTNRYWNTHVQDAGFSEITKGKEVGHRIADYVDDKTTALLKVHFDTRYEADQNGLIRKRSMGDVWVNGNGIFNPVNVKAGLRDMNGQPNLVSMQKLLDYIFYRWIDSYYLLIVKFQLEPAIEHEVVLVDLLDWVDYITYDAGPGQIMLRERDFFSAVRTGVRPASRTMGEKVDALFRKFEDGVESLARNRKNRLERQRKQFLGFGVERFVVDQSTLRFSP